ncbi:MAG: PDZ domain-containing protein, partial [Myxococcales bacterium]|nr:PDZ domain-containing protein [Myxococcales bacterium]
GARLAADGDALRVLGVIAGGGAAEAGLVEGDRIVTVDGTAVTALGLDGAIQQIRGPVGTQVVLGIEPGAGADGGASGGPRRDVTVTRRKIRA